MINRSRNRQLLGYLFALGATAIWSGNFIIARGLNESISPISLAFWRWTVAVTFFLPFAFRSLIAERSILQKNLPYLSITALLGITLFNTLIYLAGHTTSAINLSLISITFPVFIIILLRIFWGEPLSINKGFGILLVATGVTILVTKGNPAKLFQLSFAIGDLWMLVAAVIFAVYSILLRHKPKELSVRAFQLSTFILGLIFLFPFFLWDPAAVSPVEFDGRTVLSVLYVGIFASLTAFVLWNKAIMLLGPAKAGMVYYILPLFSALLAHFFLDEYVTVNHFYSLLFILSGIFTANYEFRRRE